MPPRSRKKAKKDPVRWIVRLLPRKFKTAAVLIINLLLIAAGAIWFSCQPEPRKQEVLKILGNYLDGDRKISIGEMAYDLYSLYYGSNAIHCDYRQGKAPVYGGLPQRKDGTTLTILPNQAYWVGYDETRKNPAWAAYKLVHVKKGTEVPERPAQFYTDERTIAKVASDEYTGSGFDRGHLAPNNAIARCYGPDAQRETFLMSNIVPQRHAINAGNWKTLETKEAQNYTDRFDDIWIIAGPVFTSKTPRNIPGGVPVPDAFFKIQVDEREGAIRTQAFLFKHTGNGKEELETMLVSIRELETMTGLDFFPELPQDVQDKIELNTASSVW